MLYSSCITVEICAYIYTICATQKQRGAGNLRTFNSIQIQCDSRFELSFNLVPLCTVCYSVLQLLLQLVGAKRVCMLGVPLTDWRNEKRLWPKVSKSGLVSRSVAVAVAWRFHRRQLRSRRQRQRRKVAFKICSYSFASSLTTKLLTVCICSNCSCCCSFWFAGKQKT